MTIPYRQWGEHHETPALLQMERAKALPVAVAAALMPDAHPGYGLPIGGVLATDNAVIPYAVGVDIACRMRLDVLDVPLDRFSRDRVGIRAALSRETSFGVGAYHKPPLQHPVMGEDWEFCGVVRKHRAKAAEQLGTSGSGNHFVSFGIVTLGEPQAFSEEPGAEPLPAGAYFAVLSHSGSRGLGFAVADHYSRIAAARGLTLPEGAERLAWLDMDSDAGREYWQAMELCGRYASACHALIHARIRRHLKAHTLASVENHHNFAWRERHFGRDVIVHRKGATPMNLGQLGVIPGTMADPGFVVRGRGCAESLCSASHGAGRRMSRSEAKNKYTRKATREFAAARGVDLMEGGGDEHPLVYKDIEAVMAAQADLVEVLARFDPKIVRMADGREKAED